MRCLRAIARPVLYPFDRLSYAVYAVVHRPRAEAGSFDLPRDMQRILVLAPHQDDELLGCGGFMVKYSGGRFIQVAYVTDGKGRAHRTPEAQTALAERRKNEATAVCRTLHLGDPVFLGFEDGNVRNDERVVPALEELIGRTKPHIIMAPFITDGGHPDHVATSRALANVSDALLNETELWLYQVHSHIPDWLLNRYVELGAREHEAKENALRLYESQDMTNRLTLSKYLLFSRVSPQTRKRPQVVSVEHFSVLKTGEFKALWKLWDVDDLASRIKSINYSPYSFRHFLSNERVFAELRDRRHSLVPGHAAGSKR